MLRKLRLRQKKMVLLQKKKGVYRISPPAGIYLFKVSNRKPERCGKSVQVNNKDTRTTSMVSLMLTLNKFHTLF